MSQNLIPRHHANIPITAKRDALGRADCFGGPLLEAREVCFFSAPLDFGDVTRVWFARSWLTRARFWRTGFWRAGVRELGEDRFGQGYASCL